MTKKPFKVLSKASLAGVLAVSALVPVAAASAATSYAVDEIIVTVDGQNVAISKAVYDAAIAEGWMTGATVSYVQNSDGKYYSKAVLDEAVSEESTLDKALELLAGSDKAVTITTVPGEFVEGNLVPQEEQVADLKVESVSAITDNAVTVDIAEATQDFPEAEVVVKNGSGEVVPTQTTLVAEGATSAEFLFVTPLKEADKVGVWTVNGKEFSFDAINQLADITEAAAAGNQIDFQNALDAAGITYADELKIADYLTAVANEGAAFDLGEGFAIETLADVQKVVDAVDNKTSEDAADAAKVKAVVDAKTQAQLLKALQDNFEAVNSAWIVNYAEETTVSGDATELLDITEVGSIEASDIQGAVYTANATAISADVPTTAAEQAKHTALIEKWMKPDTETPKVTAKAEAIAASKEAEAEFKVVEATTPNTLYNALVAYANLVADEDDATTLKASELNSNLKAEYFVQLKGDTDAGITAFNPETEDIKDDIVAPADAAAKTAALTAIVTAYEAINVSEGAEEGSATATEKTALKTALQKLANVTSHKTGADKFDGGIVVDENLVAYAAEFAEATAIDATSTVTAVVADVNKVNNAVSGVVSTPEELAAALASDKIEKITLKNSIKYTSNVVLKDNVVLDGNGNSLSINTIGDGSSEAVGLHIPAGAKNVVVENIVITTTSHTDNLIEIYSDATLNNVTAVGGSKAGIYVNNDGTGTITVNFKDITTDGNGWNAGIGLVSQQSGSKVVANFSGTNSFGEDVAVYTDNVYDYLGQYEVNGLDNLKKQLIGNQWKWLTGNESAEDSAE